MDSEARAVNATEHFSPVFFSWRAARIRMGGAAIFVGLCIAAALLFTGLFYVWTSMGQVQIGYQISTLEAKNRDLKNRKRELLLEIASLQSPGELEKKARKQGLVFPAMGKVVHVP